MRDPERIDAIMHDLAELWKLYPDWRLGQLILNSTHVNEDGTLKEHGYPINIVEDDSIHRGIQGLLKRARGH